MKKPPVKTGGFFCGGEPPCFAISLVYIIFEANNTVLLYQIYSNTSPYFTKEKNGDHLLHHYIDHENLLIAVVADGVSKQPCDWYASELACQQLKQYFLQNHKLSMTDRIKKSILETNDDLNKVEGPCQRLASTLTLVVYQTNGSKCFIASIGDSRLYRCRQGILEQLTTDDVHRGSQVIMTSAGKRTVNTSSLTQVLGMSSTALTINVSTIDIEANDVLILATDGFYDARKSFQTDILAMCASPDLETSFSQTWEKFKMLANDDMTTIIIKKL